jgi:hypothetical protein
MDQITSDSPAPSPTSATHGVTYANPPRRANSTNAPSLSWSGSTDPIIANSLTP